MKEVQSVNHVLSYRTLNSSHKILVQKHNPPLLVGMSFADSARKIQRQGAPKELQDLQHQQDDHIYTRDPDQNYQVFEPYPAENLESGLDFLVTWVLESGYF